MWSPRHAAAATVAATLFIACAGTVPSPIAQPSTSTGPRGSAAPPPPASGTGQIEGRVYAAAARTPIGRARVTLTSASLPAPRVTLTGADGGYRFTALPAGTYTITASRSGFAARTVGEAPGTALVLGPASRLTAEDLLLSASGTIAGRILDEDGTPFRGAVVQALEAAEGEAGRALDPVAETRSDDTGEFRLAGLPAGRYVVAASDPAFAGVGDEHGPLHYAPTYYPGVALAEHARVVPVEEGGPPPRAEFRLRIVPPAQVSGRLVPPDGQKLRSAAVLLAPVGTHARVSGTDQDVSLQPDGRFRIRNVAPGRYQVRARAELEARQVAHFATYLVIVEGRDVTDVSMTLEPGAILEGRIEADAGARGRPPLDRLRLRAPFEDGTSFGDALTGSVSADGAFEIRGLMAGRHHLVVEGLPPPWFVASMARQGRDFTDRPLEIADGASLREIRIVLSDAGAEVAGEVTGGDGAPLPDRLVIAGPADPDGWRPTSRTVRVTRTDAAGRFRLAGLPPGEYRVAAPPVADDRALFQPDVIRRAIESGHPATLAGGDTRTLHLVLTGARPGPARR
jgi:protocatechuate 3,4-dioxygenase beta subunit